MISRQLKTLAEPRDNVNIFPPKGNLHLSSYKRLGPDDERTGVSETRAMLSQIELKDEYKPISYPRRTLLTMQSIASAEKDYEEEEENLKMVDILSDPTIQCVNYRTTMGSDYRLIYPAKCKPPPPPPPPPEPWLLNRRTIGYSLYDLENRDGYHKFLDDDMDLHKSIAELKMRRGKLHNIFMDDEQQRNSINELSNCRTSMNTT